MIVKLKREIHFIVNFCNKLSISNWDTISRQNVKTFFLNDENQQFIASESSVSKKASKMPSHHQTIMVQVNHRVINFFKMVADLVYRMHPFAPSFVKLGYTFFIIFKRYFSKMATSIVLIFQERASHSLVQNCPRVDQSFLELSRVNQSYSELR